MPRSYRHISQYEDEIIELRVKSDTVFIHRKIRKKICRL